MARIVLPYLHVSWLRVNCNNGTNEAKVTNQGAKAPLTEREREVFQWMQLGKSNNEISQVLGISRPTVKNHVQKILRKLGVSNRTQAAAVGLGFQGTPHL